VNRRLLLASYTTDRIRHALPIVPFTFSNCVLVLHSLESCLGSNPNLNQGTFLHPLVIIVPTITTKIATRNGSQTIQADETGKRLIVPLLYSQSQPSRPSAAKPLAEFPELRLSYVDRRRDTTMRTRVWLLDGRLSSKTSTIPTHAVLPSNCSTTATDST